MIFSACLQSAHTSVAFNTVVADYVRQNVVQCAHTKAGKMWRLCGDKR